MSGNELDVSVNRWRVFECTTPGYWGIELEQAGNDDDPIMYPIKIHRERVAIVVDAHNAALSPQPVTKPAMGGGEEPIVQLTTGMRELRASLIARTVRQSLRNYGHKTAESVLPECIAAEVESALTADEKMWRARDCGVAGGSLTEARDCIGSAYTRAALTTGGEEL